MISEFMKETPIKKAMQDLVVFNMDGPYFGLTEKPYGISYSVYYYEHFQAVSPYTRLIEIDGVLAGYETIRTRKYPYTTEVYEVIRKDEPFGTGVRLLYNWLQTEEGQKLVMESGYVPIN
jgi:phosphate transport system substrate-binding protein